MTPSLAIATWGVDLWHRVSGPGLDSAVTVTDLLLTLFLAFACGQLVAWTYSWTHRGLSYSREFVQSLMMVSMIVAMVMNVVGDSLARAFGLVGALAIIRFRTAVRDTRDIAFVFLALAAGIAAGSSHYLSALIGTPVICAVAAWLTWIGFGGRHDIDAFLSFRVEDASTVDSALRRALHRYCRSFKLVSINAGGNDEGSAHSFQLQIHDAGLCDPLLDALGSIDGVSRIDLMVQDADGRT